MQPKAIPASAKKHACHPRHQEHLAPRCQHLALLPVARVPPVAAKYQRPASLGGRGRAGAHAPSLGHSHSTCSSTGSGARLHPSLRASAAASAASQANERHFHLLLKYRRLLLRLTALA